MKYPQKKINTKSALFFIFAFCFVIYTFSYHFHDYYLNQSDAIIYVYNDSDYLIHTKGCYIPNYGKKMKFIEAKIIKNNCGDRAVFLYRSKNNEGLDFRIDEKIMKTYEKNKKVNCFYKFGIPSTTTGHENTSLSYTQWQPLKTGTHIELQSEIIEVKCNATQSEKNKPATVYEDAYVFIKKIKTNTTKTKEKTWNVLLVGMDTMSRERLRNSMPRTAKYFQEHDWLDYKGYHKVGYNTFPNLMAFLSGRKMKTVYKRCSNDLYSCNDLFMWSKFRDAGYMTVYGEDNLSLPDTFARYNGFRHNPTHHYIRPFFLIGEKQIGNLVCSQHQPSALHLLNYANDFTNAYKEDKFFGMFWINSYSHNLGNNPQLLDNDMVGFFERLKENEIMNNTIILFISDHGIRFGKMRMPIESYYEERLPMLYVWIPHGLRTLHKDKYKNLLLNQNRLLSPYDIYLTLAQISSNFKTIDVESEACPQCTSLFVEKSTERTCENAGIDDKWCSCHNMTAADLKDSATQKSVYTAVKSIQDLAQTIKTKTSKGCRSTKLNKIIRVHRYSGSGNRTLYVVAWSMTPGKMAYEATVARDGNTNNFTVLKPTYGIESYGKRASGSCVKNMNDREFCVC